VTSITARFEGSATSDPTRPFRRGLLGLAGLTVVGIAVELAIERHWTQPGQLIAWGALVLTAVAAALLLGTPSAQRVRVARLLAGLVIGTAFIGIWQHIAANYDAAPLDFRYGPTWDSLPELERWWLAMSKTVGPSPPLAPGALAMAALSVLLASARHPALSRQARGAATDAAARAPEQRIAALVPRPAARRAALTAAHQPSRSPTALPRPESAPGSTPG
jgi:hypothetical protein